jgi:hypothetical protein
MIPKKKPILCLDFDGVVHSYTSGWQGMGVVPDPPVDGAIRFLERAAEAFEVAIYSSRSRSLRGRWAMQAWLEKHVIAHFGVDRTGADDLLVAIRWPWFKPSAFVTIDDRALTFTGTWPTIADLRDFRPWDGKVKI